MVLSVACLHLIRAARQEQGGCLALFKRLWDSLTGSDNTPLPKAALRHPPIRKRPTHRREHSTHTFVTSATFSDDPLPPIQPIHRGVPRRPIDTPAVLKEHADSIQAFRTYLQVNGRLDELREFDRRQAKADEEVKEDVARAERYMDSVELLLKPYESPEFIQRNQPDGETERPDNE